MPRFILVTLTSLFLLFFTPAKAQGVYQLWGSTPAGGSSGAGNIYSVDSIGGRLTNRFSFPALNAGGGIYKSGLLKWNNIYLGFSEWNSVLFTWDPITNIYTKKIDLESYGLWGTGTLAAWNNKIYGIAGDDDIGFDGGVIFEWDPATNIFVVKYHFAESTGFYSESGMTLLNNKFYGMTYMGGSGTNDNGVLFEWDPVTNQYDVQLDFGTIGNGASSGDNDLFAVNGKLYGTYRYAGDPRVFEWDPVLKTFTKQAQLPASIPVNLAYGNGKFYGATEYGGTDNGGILFEWDPVTNILLNRKNISPLSSNPHNSLTFYNGKLYGSTTRGGDDDSGVLFEWDPITNGLVKKIDWGELLGIQPTDLVADGAGKLYGMYYSSEGVAGSIFAYDITDNTLTDKIHFNADISKGVYPLGDLTYHKGDLYGTAYEGGLDNSGILFKYKPGMQTLSSQKDFDTLSSSRSSAGSGLVIKDNKFYGRTEYGELFEWDPLTDAFTVKANTGWGYNDLFNNKELIYFNNHFYGLLKTYDGLCIYEWNPSQTTITLKATPIFSDNKPKNAALSFYNNKFYVLLSDMDIYPSGALYEWDPLTTQPILKHVFTEADGAIPSGNLVERNGLLYGTTTEGGINNTGTIFEWNPSTNTYTKKIDLSVATGAWPKGTLTLSNNKFYGHTRGGGPHNKGVIFEWDPVSNHYAVKSYFTGDNGTSPTTSSLVRIPAPVAAGTPGVCSNYSSVLIDNNNNNKWVPLIDDKGDVIAEINANGNNLGIVSGQLYTHPGAVREDAAGRLYLNRNLNISHNANPQIKISVRLYISDNEFFALRDAVNSNGQPSGITSINDIAVFRGDPACSDAVQASASQIASGNIIYDNGYILTASFSSAASFFFANKKLPSIGDTISACVGENLTLTASTTGTTYQWQLNTGSGFTNVVNDAHHTGSNTAVLNISNLPSSWYGYAYRCLTDGIPGNTYTLRFANIWTGTVDNHWENPGNWSCGSIPDGQTNVIINNGSVNVNSNITIRSLTLASGVQLTINPGYTMTITN